MATTKTTTLTFRIEPVLKGALRTAAQQEHRSIPNIEKQGCIVSDALKKLTTLLAKTNV